MCPVESKLADHAGDREDRGRGWLTTSPPPPAGGVFPELGESGVQLEDVDVLRAEEAELGGIGLAGDEAVEDLLDSPVAFATMGTSAQASARVMSGSSPLPEVVRGPRSGSRPSRANRR
jgi:hypothetical protein